MYNDEHYEQSLISNDGAPRWVLPPSLLDAIGATLEEIKEIGWVPASHEQSIDFTVAHARAIVFEIMREGPCEEYIRNRIQKPDPLLVRVCKVIDSVIDSVRRLILKYLRPPEKKPRL